MHPQIQIDKPADKEHLIVANDDRAIAAFAAAYRKSLNSATTKYYEADGRGHVVRHQDVTDVLESCKARHNAGAMGANGNRHYGQIPETIIERYCAQQGVTLRDFIQNPEHSKRLLNDPDLSGFRIYKGRV